MTLSIVCFASDVFLCVLHEVHSHNKLHIILVSVRLIQVIVRFLVPFFLIIISSRSFLISK